MQKRLILVLLIFQVSLTTGAQVRGLIRLVDSQVTQSCFERPAIPDSIALFSMFSKCISHFHNLGYLEARIDSIHFDSSVVTAYGYKGSQYLYACILPDSISKRWFDYLGINVNRYVGKPISSITIGNMFFQTISKFENKGYPFARVELKNTRVSQGQLFADINVETGPLITLDTLYFKGDLKVNRHFLEAYLGYSKGQAYSEKLLQSFNQKLQRLDFVKIIRPNELEFIPEKARVYTYLSNNNANQFSGIVGFASEEGSKPRIKFTGDIRLRLSNVFRRGELYTVQWQALTEGTQRLNITSSWSYLFGTTLGLNSQFNLYRRDTSYININPRIDASFAFGNANSMGLGIDFRSSSTLSGIVGIKRYKTYLYRVSVRLGDLSSVAFPVNDFMLSLTGGVGSRSIGGQTNLPINKSVIGESTLLVVSFIQLLKQNLILKIQLQGQALGVITKHSSSAPFMENELYRVGGYGYLRGFAQESIITPSYGVASLELQHRVQNSLNIYLFADQGVVKRYPTIFKEILWPTGFGFGLQVATSGGIINLSYALGCGLGEACSLKEPKIHVGFTTQF